MIILFNKEVDDAPINVKKLGLRYRFPGMNMRNFWAWFEYRRQNFVSDEACAATYLALRKQDPCKFGLAHFCPYRNVH